VKVKGHRPTILIKDFIATRLGGAAVRLAKRAIEIERANPYSGKAPGALDVKAQLPHLFVMELAASAVILSIAALEGTINELFTEARGRFGNSVERRGNLSPESQVRWHALWQRGIPGQGYNVLEKGQIALELADLAPLPEGRGPVQHVSAVMSLRNALVHSVPSFQPHGRDLPQSERGSLENQLRGKFELSTMVAETEPFMWKRCLSAGCAKWAVETEVSYRNALYAALGIGAQGSISWDRPCEYWP
jgi:hypothetical protein